MDFFHSSSVIRPLTSIEAICSGGEIGSSGVNLGSDAASFLTDIIPVFNRIIFPSGITESLIDQIRSGVPPVKVTKNLQSELDLMIDESGEGDVLKAEIRRFVIIHGNDDQRQIGSCLEGILRSLMTQIELSPLTKEIVFKFSLSVRNNEIVFKYRLLPLMLKTYSRTPVALMPKLISKSRQGTSQELSLPLILSDQLLSIC